MATETTTLRPAWRLKMILVIIGVGALGIWGLYDASIKYPARGEKFARIVGEFEYLKTAAGPVDDRQPIRAADVSVPDPRDALADLVDRQKTTMGLSAIENNRLTWLRALGVVGKLDPQYTTYSDDGGERDPNSRLTELETEASAARSVPNAVHKFDIAVQWLIFGVCMTVVGWCSLLVIRTASKRYTYDSESKTLSLPGGKSFTVEDIEDVDKRRWHKFYATVKIREAHPSLAGREIEFDLYRALGYRGLGPGDGTHAVPRSNRRRTGFRGGPGARGRDRARRKSNPLTETTDRFNPSRRRPETVVSWSLLVRRPAHILHAMGKEALVEIHVRNTDGRGGRHGS